MRLKKKKGQGIVLDERQLKKTWHLEAMHVPESDPRCGKGGGAVNYIQKIGKI